MIDNEMLELILRGAVLLLCGIASAVILPRIKNEDVRALVRSCVRAADKLARSGQIESGEKRFYVERVLYLYGIKITAKIDAIIEAEVTDLDIEQGEITEAAAETEKEAEAEGEEKAETEE